MPTSYSLIIKLSRNENLQKYRIILSQHTNYMRKWLFHFLTCLLLPSLLFYVRFLNMHKQRTPFYFLWRAGPPWLLLYGSRLALLKKKKKKKKKKRLACLPSWMGMMNAVWSLSFFKAVPPNRCSTYLGSTLHIISSIFSHFCLFQNAILNKMLKLGFWNFQPIFLRMQLWLQHFFSSFCYLSDLIFASETVSWIFILISFNIWR